MLLLLMPLLLSLMPLLLLLLLLMALLLLLLLLSIICWEVKESPSCFRNAAKSFKEAAAVDAQPKAEDSAETDAPPEAKERPLRFSH